MNIEEHIRKALEEGKFKDLSGKGKPLRWDDNPLDDPEKRMANKILRDAGFTLGFIETWREIEAGLEEARRLLLIAWRSRRLSLDKGLPYAQIQQEWKQAEQAFRRAIENLNKRVRDYNLEAPSLQFQKQPLNADREIEKITSSE
jgi:hypothetical protein